MKNLFSSGNENFHLIEIETELNIKLKFSVPKIHRNETKHKQKSVPSTP